MALLFIQTVRFGGHTLIHLPDSHRVWLIDSAFVETDNTLLQADTILFEDTLQRLQAWGNPILIFKKEGDTLKGSYLVYRLDTQQGMALHGRSFVQKGWLEGDRMYRLTKEEILVQHGTFTTCDLDTPHYYFASTVTKAIQNNMAIVKPLVLYIRDIPVAALPFWMFPIARGRKSGFLTPRFGYSSSDGRYIRNLSYYWAASAYWDLTLTLNLFERQKVQAALEIPYKRYRSFEGFWQGSLAQEFQTGNIRYSLMGYHTQTFSPRSKFTARVQYLSDERYIRDYSESRQEFLTTSIQSYASYSYTTSLLGFSIQANRTQDLARGSLSQTLPSLQWNLPGFSWKSLRIGTNGGFDRLHQAGPDTSWTRWGARQNLSVSLPFRLLHHIQVSPSLSGYALLMDRDRNGNPYPTYANGGISLQLSTVLYGYSLFGVKPFTVFRHTLRPSISFAYTRPDSGKHLLPFGGYGPTPGGTWSASWSLSNLWEGKTSQRVVQIARLDFSQGYNPQASPDRRWSNYTASFEILPGNTQLNLRGSAQLDHPTGTLQSLRLDWGTDFAFGYPMVWTASRDSTTGKMVYDRASWRLSTSLSYQKTRGFPASQFLSVGLSGKLTEHWSLSYNTGYDLTQGKWAAQQLGVSRDLHCWQMSFSWVAQGGFWAYDFRLWIKDLPDVKVSRGLFDLFLP